MPRKKSVSTIFDNIKDVLDDEAEGLHGPEGDDYIFLMTMLIEEANLRIVNYLTNTRRR